jgi:hypothetical protein
MKECHSLAPTVRRIAFAQGAVKVSVFFKIYAHESLTATRVTEECERPA